MVLHEGFHKLMIVKRIDGSRVVLRGFACTCLELLKVKIEKEERVKRDYNLYKIRNRIHGKEIWQMR